MNLAFRLRTTTNKAPNTLKRYIAPRFVEHKTTASSRETGAAATPPPADEWARPVPAAALSRSTCRCVRQLNANTTTQLRPTCSLSVSADACRRPHLPGPAKLHSTLYKYIYFLYKAISHEKCALSVCMLRAGRGASAFDPKRLHDDGGEHHGPRPSIYVVGASPQNVSGGGKGGGGGKWWVGVIERSRRTFSIRLFLEAVA